MGSSPGGISVVYVNYHCEDLVVESIEGLAESVSPFEFEAIVVDNGSSKPESFWDAHPVRLVRSGSNVGFGRACNLGAARARFDHVLFLNPDTSPNPGEIAGMMAHMASTPGCVACGPALRSADGEPQVYWVFHHLLLWEIAEAAYLQGVWRRIYQGRMESRLGLDRPWPVPCVCGACLLVRKTEFDAVGGFDPRFFLNFEDIELCERLRSRGLVHYLPWIGMVHEEGTVQRKDWANFVQQRLQAHGTYLRIGYGGPRLKVAQIVLCLAVLLRLGLGSLVLRGEARDRLAGYRKVLGPLVRDLLGFGAIGAAGGTDGR